jgi:hypothetical protein
MGMLLRHRPNYIGYDNKPTTLYEQAKEDFESKKKAENTSGETEKPKGPRGRRRKAE